MDPTQTGEASFSEAVLGQTLVFRAGQERFGLPLKAILEVFEQGVEPIPVPGAPTWLAGMMHHHGRVIPVVHAGRLLRAAPAEDDGPARQLMLADLGDEVIALLVDQIVALEEVRSEGPVLSGGRRRAWLRGTLLTLLQPTGLAATLRERVDD